MIIINTHRLHDYYCRLHKIRMFHVFKVKLLRLHVCMLKSNQAIIEGDPDPFCLALF